MRHPVDGRVVDIETLRRFELGLDPLDPGRSGIPARVIGYGEISTIFEIEEPSLAGLAFKRLPVFRSAKEMDDYEELFREYRSVLTEGAGLRVPWQDTARVVPATGNGVVYCMQEKMAPGTFCHQLLHTLDDAAILALFCAVLGEMKKVWDFNASQNRLEVAVDAQLSNWALPGGIFPESAAGGEIALAYVDTSTPFIRVMGRERLNTELFLRSAPSFLVWLVKLFFLEDVVSRYYDPRLAVVDLVANLYKEGRADLVEPFIAGGNSFFAQNATGLSVQPLTLKEVRSYYREDAFIWRLYLSLRRLDRFLHRQVLKKPYPYILPGKIKR